MGLFSKKSRIWKVEAGTPILAWPAEGECDSMVVDALLLDVPTDRGHVDVVGESYRQATILTAAGGCDANGPIQRDHMATLLPEPGNTYDRNAVRVMLPTAGLVGYLSREDAIAFRPAIDEAARHGQVIAARAAITGGFDRGNGNRASCGVVLHMADDPQAVLEEILESYDKCDDDPACAEPLTTPSDGWYPDPLQRFQHRYWESGVWTHHVASDGVGSIDPL